MQIRVTKATDAEKAEYAATLDADGHRPVYGLYGWVTVAGHKLAVEYPDQNRGDDEGPKYEVMAPDGHHFLDGPGGGPCSCNLHSLLCYDMADLRGRLAGAELAPCNGD
jgi:hypothetical protein